jgi:hypothetical protein
MMKDFTPLVYSIPLRQEPTLYFGAFSAEYKGFSYKKETEQHLYFIVCDEDRVLPYDLSGKFSKIKHLEQAIDRWLGNNPSRELPLAPKPPRSHHKPVELGGVG